MDSFTSPCFDDVNVVFRPSLVAGLIRPEHVDGEIPATIPERQIRTKSEPTRGPCQGGYVSDGEIVKVIAASRHRPKRDVTRRKGP